MDRIEQNLARIRAAIERHRNLVRAEPESDFGAPQLQRAHEVLRYIDSPSPPAAQRHAPGDASGIAVRQVVITPQKLEASARTAKAAPRHSGVQAIAVRAWSYFIHLIWRK